MLGQAVRAHRIRLGLSQEDVARAAGVDVKTISNVEAGRTRPRAATVSLLVQALGLDGEERRRFQALALGTPADQQAASRLPVPAQLPADVAGFTGREEQLSRLDALVDALTGRRSPAGGAGSPAAVVISAVSGTAGVGKTALAVHWAHRVRDRFPDGQLYVNLHGFDPSGQVTDPATAVRGFLDAFEIPAHRIPTSFDAQAALYRSLVADRRMLIVLDNARDSAQVRPLLPGSPGCLVVVASRNELTSLIAGHGAQPVTLDLLTPEEAGDLLARRIGNDRVTAAPDAVAEIVTRCARLPLALSLVAAHAAIRPETRLEVLAEGLRDTQRRWQTLATDDPGTDVRSVFSWSYQTLTPAAARLFRLLSRHPGADLGAPAAASLAGLPLTGVAPLLAELSRAHLVIEHTPGRYSLHDLLRAYAAERAGTTESGDELRAATHRVLDHYLQTAYVAERLLNPNRDPITVAGPAEGVTAERLTDHRRALAWLTAEHQVLLAAVDQAAAAGFHTHAWQLTWTLWTFLERRARWRDNAATGETAVSATAQLADPAAQAFAHANLGLVYTRLDRFDDAYPHLRCALELYGTAGDPAGQGYTHGHLGYLAVRQGDYARAVEHARQALRLYEAIGHQAGRARALNNLGWSHAQLGEFEQALAACQEAVAVHHALGNQIGQGNALHSLGYTHHRLGHHREALACFQGALSVFRELDDRCNEADTLVHVGDTQHEAGNPAAARDAYRHALRILTELSHPDAEQVRRKLAAL